MILFWALLAIIYLFGFLITCAVGAWIMWDGAWLLGSNGERQSMVAPEKDDLFMLALVASFFWWLFILPIMGYWVLGHTVKVKNEIVRKELDLLEFEKRKLADQRADLEKLQRLDVARMIVLVIALFGMAIVSAIREFGVFLLVIFPAIVMILTIGWVARRLTGEE